MARFAAGLLTGMAIMTIAGAALGIHSQDASTDVREAAQAAGYDETELRGALSSLEVAGKPADPWTYARFEGRLPPLTEVGQKLTNPPVSGVWARLAACESTSNWRANTGNSYYGGLQQDMSFWIRYGGLAYAPRPDLASPAAQIAVAERGLAVQGFGAWPACSRRLGLR